MTPRHLTAYERVTERLSVVRQTADGVMALCPAHDDHNPSLSVSKGQAGALVYCHAGCPVESVVGAIGMELHDLFNDGERSGSEVQDRWLPGGLEWIDAYEYCDADGVLRFQVVRARDKDGKTFRQRRPDASSPHGWRWSLSDLQSEDRALPYRLPEVVDAIKAGRPVWIAEGEKDVEALRRSGVTATCNAGGAGKWTAAHSTHFNNAHVVITRDQDAMGRRHQAEVAESLKGIAANVALVEPAAGKDAADHLGSGLELNDFSSIDEAEQLDIDAPSPSVKFAAGPAPAVGDVYADSPVSERVVAEALQGRWLWATGLGWMAWSGSVWEARSGVAATEVVRRWVDGEVARVALRGDRRETERAAALQATNRIDRILKLARGQVLANVADFDQDPDLLVCGNGVVDLRTGDLMEHDPARRVSRMTPVDYRPHADHSDWSKALDALPNDVRAWAQLRLGQAATGHTPDDDRMLFFLGSGENGKTTLMAAVMSALGSYSGLVPDRLLLANADAHPTEMMSLRGLRLAVIEETPEGRRLSIARLKKTVGTPWITARLVYRDSTTFKATHALLLTSNYRPVIEETDHGTWRRLGLVTFPFRFTKPGAELAAWTDRHGDPRLRARLHERSQQETVLAWLVRGAKAWYDAGGVMPTLPERVERDNHAWREESDSVLAYATERLEPDPSSWVLAKDLLADLNHWLAERGQQAWSDRTVAARFGPHDWTTAQSIEKKKVRHRRDALSRSYYHCTPGQAPASYMAWVGVRFRNPAEDERAVPAVRDRSELSSISRTEKVPRDPEHPEHTPEAQLKVVR